MFWAFNHLHFAPTTYILNLISAALASPQTLFSAALASPQTLASYFNICPLILYTNLYMYVCRVNLILFP
jgi:hypothetical protein